MNKSKFIITGLSRSGTKFLWNIMNRSNKIDVFHDHGVHRFAKQGLLNFCDRKNLTAKKENELIQDLQSTFKNNKGYISAAYRIDICSFKFEKSGVILRHPEKILVSYANMHKNTKNVKDILINYIDKELKNLDSLIENGSYFIKFEKITSDLNYLKSVLNYFGIDDIDINNKDIEKKINKLENKFTIDDFKKSDINLFRDKIKWFIEKYNLIKV